MHELLHGENDAILDSETNSGTGETDVSLIWQQESVINAYPEFSTALFAYSTYACPLAKCITSVTRLECTWNIRPSGE